MTDIINAIKAINPNAKVSINAEDINQISWHDSTPVISNVDILAKQTELQAAYDSQAYSRSRATAYAALNQFEMQFDDAANSTTTWVDAINAIKQEFPK